VIVKYNIAYVAYFDNIKKKKSYCIAIM